MHRQTFCHVLAAMFFFFIGGVATECPSGQRRWLSSPGCSLKSPPSYLEPGGPSKNLTLSTEAYNRTYLLHLPRTYKPGRPVPLYFSFSGADRNATEQEGLSQFSNPLFNPYGIAVYPQPAHGEHWLSNPSVPDAFPTDIDFVLDLIDQLERELCIDRSRLYAAGKSNGGGFTNLLACNATSAAKFAAFASVSGAYYKDAEALQCHPAKKPIPFLEFHGLDDTTVPYYGTNDTNATRSEFGVPAFLQGWVDRNGCTKDARPVVKKGLFPQGLVNRFRWSCGGFKDVVQHYQEVKLGHIWPSTVPNDDCKQIPAQCPMGHYTFNATKVIFDFFHKWSLEDFR